MLQKLTNEIAFCLRRAAEAEARHEAIADAQHKADYRLIANTWRRLAPSHQLQESLSRYVSFMERKGMPSISSAGPETISSHGSADAARNDVFETVLRNTPFLLARCSFDLRYLFVSDACARMLGREPEDLVGEKIIDVIGESAFQVILPHVNTVLGGQRVEFQA